MTLLETHLNRIAVGDSLKLIKDLPDECVKLSICSPPYFQQRTYTDLPEEIGREQEIDDYLENVLKIFIECLRVTQDDGNIIFNLGDKYIKSNLMLLPWRFALLAQKKATLINAVTWVKNNPTPRQFDRRLVSSTEPFFHFVKNIKTYHYDLSVLNVQEEKGVNPDSKVGQGYFKQIDESDLSDEEKANAYVDLAKIIEEVKEGKIESLRMKIRGKHSLPFGGQEGGRKTQIETKGYSIIRVPGGKMHRDVVETPVETIRGINHPAIYPRAIVEQFIKTTTHPGDLVFDPFIGSGTTGLVAKQLGRNFIGFELCPEFAKQAQLRIESGVIA